MTEGSIGVAGEKVLGHIKIPCKRVEDLFKSPRLESQ